MIILLTVIITWLVGPIAFYLISKFFYKGIKKFPSNIVGEVGDFIFLPIFNGLAVNNIVSNWKFVSSTDLRVVGLFTVIFTIFYLIYKFKIQVSNWSSFQRNNLNIGFYYHLAFVFAQSFLIIFALINFPYSFLLWLPLLGYIMVFIYYRLSQRQNNN